MNATYTINETDVAQFHKLVENANKKAAKVGATPYTVTVGKPFAREYMHRNRRYTEIVVEVTIVGTTPKFNGWKLVGVVSPLKTDSGELLPLVTTVPGEHVKTAAQSRDPLWCDHCKVRRDRLESFIVAHEDGSEKQVGRNCLKDFLGDDRMSPAGLAGLMNTLSAISDKVTEWHKGPRQFSATSLNLVLACSISAIRAYGWVSSKEAYVTGKTATKTRVNEILYSFVAAPDCSDLTADAAHEEVVRWGYSHSAANLPTAADFAKASEYRNNLSVMLDEEPEGNEYMDALRLLNYVGAVNPKAMGIAASIVATVDRKMGVETNPIKAILTKAQATSKHVGEPKKRMEFSGVTFIENFQTSTGMTVATFVTADGNVLKAFSHQTLNPGQKVNLKATVVRHDTFKGANQTVVNRPVVTK
jgi:hypothetical protein